MFATALLAVPALAGHYEQVTTYTGNSLPGQYVPSDTHANGDGYVTDWSVWNGILSTSAYFDPVTPGQASATGNVKTVFKWQADDLTDTAPDEVWVAEGSGLHP